MQLLNILSFTIGLLLSHIFVIAKIRGVPGLDYPNYTSIPVTSFQCSHQQSTPGFYADFETRCQVFHHCYNHRKESFLCPLGTTFNQAIKSCDYWYSSECDSTQIFPYVQNPDPNGYNDVPYVPVQAKTNNIFDKMVALYEPKVQDSLFKAKEVPEVEYVKEQTANRYVNTDISNADSLFEQDSLDNDVTDFKQGTSFKDFDNYDYDSDEENVAEIVRSGHSKQPSWILENLKMVEKNKDFSSDEREIEENQIFHTSDKEKEMHQKYDAEHQLGMVSDNPDSSASIVFSGDSLTKRLSDASNISKKRLRRKPMYVILNSQNSPDLSLDSIQYGLEENDHNRDLTVVQKHSFPSTEAQSIEKTEKNNGNIEKFSDSKPKKNRKPLIILNDSPNHDEISEPPIILKDSVLPANIMSPSFDFGSEILISSSEKPDISGFKDLASSIPATMSTIRVRDHSNESKSTADDKYQTTQNSNEQYNFLVEENVKGTNNTNHVLGINSEDMKPEMKLDNVSGDLLNVSLENIYPKMLKLDDTADHLEHQDKNIFQPDVINDYNDASVVHNTHSPIITQKDSFDDFDGNENQSILFDESESFENELTNGFNEEYIGNEHNNEINIALDENEQNLSEDLTTLKIDTEISDSGNNGGIEASNADSGTQMFYELLENGYDYKFPLVQEEIHSIKTKSAEEEDLSKSINPKITTLVEDSKLAFIQSTNSAFSESTNYNMNTYDSDREASIKSIFDEDGTLQFSEFIAMESESKPTVNLSQALELHKELPINMNEGGSFENRSNTSGPTKSSITNNSELDLQKEMKILDIFQIPNEILPTDESKFVGSLKNIKLTEDSTATKLPRSEDEKNIDSVFHSSSFPLPANIFEQNFYKQSLRNEKKIQPGENKIFPLTFYRELSKNLLDIKDGIGSDVIPSKTYKTSKLRSLETDVPTGVVKVGDSSKSYRGPSIFSIIEASKIVKNVHEILTKDFPGLKSGSIFSHRIGKISKPTKLKKLIAFGKNILALKRAKLNDFKSLLDPFL